MPVEASPTRVAYKLSSRKRGFGSLPNCSPIDAAPATSKGSRPLRALLRSPHLDASTGVAIGSDRGVPQPGLPTNTPRPTEGAGSTPARPADRASDSSTAERQSVAKRSPHSDVSIGTARSPSALAGAGAASGPRAPGYRQAYTLEGNVRRSH